MKSLIIALFLLLSVMGYAGALHSPYPSLINGKADFYYLYSIKESQTFEIDYYAGGSLDFSIYPSTLIPALNVDTGILLGHRLWGSRSRINLSTGIGLLINPFIYRESLHSTDFILINRNRLFISQREPFKSIFIEPYIGGSIDLFISTQFYTGIKPWISLDFGIKLLFK